MSHWHRKPEFLRSNGTDISPHYCAILARFISSQKSRLGSSVDFGIGQAMCLCKVCVYSGILPEQMQKRFKKAKSEERWVKRPTRNSAAFAYVKCKKKAMEETSNKVPERTVWTVTVLIEKRDRRLPVHGGEHLAESAGMLNSYRADLVAYHMLRILARIWSVIG